MTGFSARLATVLAFTLVAGQAFSQELPRGYWSQEQASEVLAKTRRVHLGPDLSALSAPEQAAVEKLLGAGRIMNRLFEDSMHAEALASRQELAGRFGDSDHGRALLDLYYLFRGPVATTLDNRREAFLPVTGETPGKNMYPPGISRGDLDPLLEKRPEWAALLLDLRHVVRATSAENLARDLAALDRHPMLDGLHPGLRDRLEALSSGEDDFPVYALPYSVNWADDITRAYSLIHEASEALASHDPDFSDFLALRAYDLVTDNYEGGDAAWVRGRFGALNAQIGSYEVYGDALYGVKSLFSLSLLARNEGKSRELSAALEGLQSIQDSLPHGAGRKIQQDIPVGVYDVIADFGQARGANTASILPNDAAHSRKYGRTILMRYNIMTHPGLFSDQELRFTTAVAAHHAGDLSLEGPFYRTLWHEVGHYLGVDQTDDGRELNDALSPWGSHFEEMKADLVSLYTAAHLNREGRMSDGLLRSVQAGGVLRVLQSNRPRTADQPYETMQLMQMNYFLANGLLAFDEVSGRLVIHYAAYDRVAAGMLGEVLAIQAAGDRERAGKFIERYTEWTPGLHERLAQRLREAEQYRYRLVTYEVLQ